MSMSMSLYAIDWWADINAEIRLNERKLSKNEFHLSELYTMREKAHVPYKIHICPGDTAYIVERVFWGADYSYSMDFWKNMDYKNEYWTAVYVPVFHFEIEKNYVEWQFLCPCLQKIFDLCSKMDIDGLRSESEKYVGTGFTNEHTESTILTQIIFNPNGKRQITTFEIKGYDCLL